ncbi:hypothetical protein LWI29_020713 [Acer saccharum]|uniref:Uncharacterized protein n=1 Tax=Acer saccharum TaxID=4024 RepID=A0AA39RM68_ACESA|nr:hypothetical protein LWI29_020713 [Acer saccharum]
MCTVECRDAKGGSKTLPEEKQNMVRILWKHRQLQPSVQEQGKCHEWSLSCTTSRICMFLLLQMLIKVLRSLGHLLPLWLHIQKYYRYHCLLSLLNKSMHFRVQPSTECSY